MPFQRERSSLAVSPVAQAFPASAAAAEFLAICSEAARRGSAHTAKDTERPMPIRGSSGGPEPSVKPELLLAPLPFGIKRHFNLFPVLRAFNLIVRFPILEALHNGQAI